MFSTTEITSHEDVSDNVIHQRLFYAYVLASGEVNGEVLEIGCGAGRGLQLLLDACNGYTGIDKNEQLLQLHQSNYPQHKFISGNVPPLTTFEDNTFDYIVSFQVIEHIQEDDLFVKEIHRVLKPGGKAIITTPNINLSLTRNPWHVREYTASGLRTLLEKYFDKVEVKGIIGDTPVMEYYENNKASVEKITRWDVLNLQYRLPRSVLQVPYEILNRLNRKKLQKGNNDLVKGITTENYSLTEEAEKGFDFYCVVVK